MSPTKTHPAPILPTRIDDKWRREHRAFRGLLPDLLRSHRDQYVAIHEGQVVESGSEKLEVARRAYSRFGYVPIFVSRVSDEPIAPVRVPSPRLPTAGTLS
jgi:hypothetical protein